MSNKNDPYNYALAYQQAQLPGEQKNLINQDSDLESLLGTVVMDKGSQDESEDEDKPSQSFVEKL